VNAFVRRVRGAGTFAMRMYVTIGWHMPLPRKWPSRGDLDPSNNGFFDLRE